MAVQVYDPYPLETAWRETLPVDNVLHNLEYGLMSEFIFDLVKEFRSNKRYLKVQTLIRSITHSIPWHLEGCVATESVDFPG